MWPATPLLKIKIMKINSAKFIKSVPGDDPIFADGIPQVAFIGRSNVGKSSVINSLVNQVGLARTSAFPGRTQLINLFLINEDLYLVDLPGYGFAKLSNAAREELWAMVNWYFFNLPYNQKKIILIIDANVGLTKDDAEMLKTLEDHHKEIVVVANKVDKLKRKDYGRLMQEIKKAAGNNKVIPYSAEEKIGVGELLEEIL